MTQQAFSILGLPSNAALSEIRRAYRKLALHHHPDRNPGDSGANARFQRIRGAYRDALRVRAGRKSPQTRGGPRPDRFGCPSCGDRFPFPENCPRCDLKLQEGEMTYRNPSVDALIDSLEARAARPHRAPPDPRKMATALSGTFLTGGWMLLNAGPPVAGVLFVAFGCYMALVGALEHSRILAFPIRA